MNNRIGVFDSGIGGLTTLEEIKKLLPKEDYIFYADSGNNPYGSKTDEELLKITKNIVEFLIEKQVKMIVIACNTASNRCIKKLRELYPEMIFIGTEPAIKVACDHGFKNTLVLATPGTISAKRTHELVEKNKKKGQNIFLIACEGLANAIERHDKEEIHEILDRYLLPFEYCNVDAVVLGCTHYPHIRDEIQEYFPKAKMIDGNEGVARRVKQQLEEHNLLNDKGKTKVEFIQTK